MNEVPVAEKSKEGRGPDFPVAMREEGINGHLRASTSDINRNRAFRESRGDLINISKTKLTSSL
jgi:hypothetical protein